MTSFRTRIPAFVINCNSIIKLSIFSNKFVIYSNFWRIDAFIIFHLNWIEDTRENTF